MGRFRVHFGVELTRPADQLITCGGGGVRGKKRKSSITPVLVPLTDMGNTRVQSGAIKGSALGMLVLKI